MGQTVSMEPLQANLDTALIFAGWLVVAMVFVLRRRSGATTEKRRDPRSILGIVLQGVGFAIAFNWRRGNGAPFLPGSGSAGAHLVTLLIAGLVATGCWLLTGAVRALGKQWSLAARVLEGHELITAGPFRFVRHPIYTGMMGFMLATGLALGTWQGLIAASLLYVLGTTVRISSEERLMRAQFGRDYEDYASRVPALFPLFRGWLREEGR
jgi:protein-S-isoprenylcysteine O-methyltransferase Ste14